MTVILGLLIRFNKRAREKFQTRAVKIYSPFFIHHPSFFMEVVTEEQENRPVKESEEVVSSEGEDEEEADMQEDEDAAEVDLAEAEVEDEDDQPGASENVDPNTLPTETASIKSRAPTCPLDIPISVVRRIMKSAAPNRRFTPELISAFARSAGTFALYLLSATQDAAIESSRSTIRPVEVINGLISCGFPELAEETRIAMGLGNITNKKKKTKKR